ncbi:MAG: PorP/SprF family type IX secretion system membrane protein [Crocinitomicaceae bacterium]
MKKIAIAFILISNVLFGQDIHFSQLGINNLLNNPAAAGFYNGWERLAVNHKNQWINANTNFLTTGISADMNLFKPQRGKGAYLGVGITFYNDIGGDSKFGLRNFSGSISAVVPISSSGRISFGFSSGFGQKSANLENVLFPNQFDGSELNSAVPSLEAQNLSSNLYGDFGFGFLYQYGSVQQSIAANRNMSITIGMSYSHFNKPKINFNNIYIESLFAKFALGGELIKDFSGSKLGIESIVNQYIQGPHSETYIASLLRFQLSSGSKVTRLKKSVVLSGGIGYRYNDAIVPILKYQKGDWQFGLSYDVTISKLGSYKRTGGLEFSLIYNSQRFALIKRR